MSSAIEPTPDPADEMVGAAARGLSALQAPGEACSATTAELDAYLARVRGFSRPPRTRSPTRRGCARSWRRTASAGGPMPAEQHEPGMCGIALPVTDRDGRTAAAVNVSMVHDAAAERRVMWDVLPRLRMATRRLSAVAA